MILDYFLVAFAGGTVAVQSLLGFLVTIRPPLKDRRFCYEVAFGVLFSVGLVSIIWSGLRAVQSSSHVEASLGHIEQGQKEAMDQLSRMAELLKLDPNHSAKVVANKILDTIYNLQQQIGEQNKRLAAAEKKDPNRLYQGNKVVAEVSSASISADRHVVKFAILYEAAEIDFEKEIYYRGLNVKCTKGSFINGTISTTTGTFNNEMDNVDCVTMSGILNDLTGFRNDHSPIPVPQ